MAKSIKELKKENVFLKSKSEKSDVTLIELVEEVNFTSFSLLLYLFFLVTVKLASAPLPMCLDQLTDGLGFALFNLIFLF